jgi:hypothetical protein
VFRPGIDVSVEETDRCSAFVPLVFILFPEAVSDWEEVPAPLLIEFPDIGFLACVLRVWLVNQVHQEKPKV